MSRLVLEQLTKCFSARNGPPVVAVDQLTLSLAPGELLALVGPSGCGKTTTLRLIAGLETPDAGIIKLNDQVVNAVPPKERDVAMVFQHPALYPHLTAAENLGFGLRLRGVARDEITTRVQQIAEMLGLGSCLLRKPGELSGGERQRVAVVRALINQPKLLMSARTTATR